MSTRGTSPTIQNENIHVEEQETNARLYSLVGSGHIDKGALVSAAGDSVWASSADFQVAIAGSFRAAHAA